MILANAFPDDQTLAVIAIAMILMVAIPAGLIIIVVKLWNRAKARRQN